MSSVDNLNLNLENMVLQSETSDDCENDHNNYYDNELEKQIIQRIEEDE